MKTKTPSSSQDIRRDGEVQRERVARQACAALSRADARMRRLIERIGPHRPIITAEPFVALLGSIVHQQISMMAAAAIQRRIVQLCPRRRPTAKAIAALDQATLRSAGLSRSKAQYVHNLADYFTSRKLTAAGLRRMSDEQVLEAATAVKGVGRWTAEMLLIFCLERRDVWPVDDLGLRKAVRDFHRLTDLPDNPTTERLGDKWRPYRSYATWYLWRSLEGPLMPGIELSRRPRKNSTKT